MNGALGEIGVTLVVRDHANGRAVAEQVSHADTFQRVLHLLLPLRSAGAAIRQWQLDVFIHSQVSDQVERLENKSNLAVADPRALADRELRDRLSVERILAARRRIEK